MMPGVIISSVFSEQMPLISCTTRCESELAAALKPLKDTPHQLRVQIRAAHLPGSARSELLPLEQAGLRQPFDRTVTDTAKTTRFAPAHSFGIPQPSFPSCHRVMAPGAGCPLLIPQLSFSGTAAEAVQHRSDRVVALADRQAPDDLQGLQRRRRPGRGARPLHPDCGMHAALAVQGEVKSVLRLVRARAA